MITVLIVDDSRIFRSALESCLADQDDIKVIGSVFNGEKALEFLQKDWPDIISLDMEMPGLNGLEVLDKILILNKQHSDRKPIQVLMLSAVTKKGADITMQALQKGAYDFLAKPISSSPEEGMKVLKNLIILKIRQINSKIIKAPSPIKTTPRPAISGSLNSHGFSFDAILIGVSTGGPKALMELMPSLCEVTDVPIFIVQHIPPKFSESLANGLNAKCSHTVIEAIDDDDVKSKHVYIAPGGQHMILRKSGTRTKTIITDKEPENGCRPSVDVLFRSAPSVYKGNLLVIILTGMGKDGTKSLAALKRAGAKVIAQDEASSVVWGMPGSAVDSGHVDIVLPLNQITQKIKTIL